MSSGVWSNQLAQSAAECFCEVIFSTIGAIDVTTNDVDLCIGQDWDARCGGILRAEGLAAGSELLT